MAEPDLSVRRPLFDRLLDEQREAEEEVRPWRTLDRDALLASVRRELARLLNSRCSTPVEQLEQRPRSVLDYGIPELSWFSPRNPEDRERLARLIARTVEAYEPRLRRVVVVPDSFRFEDQELLMQLDAHLVLEGTVEPISFPLALAGEEFTVTGEQPEAGGAVDQSR